MPLLLATAMITIRIYNLAAFPPSEIRAAEAAADGILAKAGISAVWLSCTADGTAEEGCANALQAKRDFVLRLQKSGAAPRGRVAMGESLIDTDTGEGVLISIDPVLVGAIAHQAAADSGTLLGRAIAHELGHLLLGSNAHAPHGLMRALWSQAELRADRPSDWVFSSGETRQILKHLAASSSAN